MADNKGVKNASKEQAKQVEKNEAAESFQAGDKRLTGPNRPSV
ncbi:hypothetical protein [Paenibacillus sp. YYML68]|nr:hypothetical protein [Paenibacillus sp. YYML68]